MKILINTMSTNEQFYVYERVQIDFVNQNGGSRALDVKQSFSRDALNEKPNTLKNYITFTTELHREIETYGFIWTRLNIFPTNLLITKNVFNWS